MCDLYAKIHTHEEALQITGNLIRAGDPRNEDFTITAIRVTRAVGLGKHHPRDLTSSGVSLQVHCDFLAAAVLSTTDRKTPLMRVRRMPHYISEERIDVRRGEASRYR